MKISSDKSGSFRSHPFDTAFPPEGHFERFGEKLMHSHSRRLRRHKWVACSAMAALIVVFLLFSPLLPHRNSSDPVKEVTLYYRMQLEEEIEKIKTEIQHPPFNNQTELLKDLNAIYREYRQAETPSFQSTPEEQISRIIRNYEAQMKSLRHIRSIFETLSQNNINVQSLNNKS